jgi:hypothetical protein
MNVGDREALIERAGGPRGMQPLATLRLSVAD